MVKKCKCLQTQNENFDKESKGMYVYTVKLKIELKNKQLILKDKKNMINQLTNKYIFNEIKKCK